MNYDIYLPSYTIGTDAYEQLGNICKAYGSKAVIIGGHKAIEAVKEKLLSSAKKNGIFPVGFVWYGGECSFENVENLKNNPDVLDADLIWAVGGGKATDTAKVVGYELNKPVFTFPTIASNCSACTSVSIMYTNEGVFVRPYFFEKPPVHAFIDTSIIAASPKKYMWAGIGDTYAKYFESAMSSRDEEVPHYISMGVANSRMCYEPILKYGVMALKDIEENNATKAFEQVVLSIIVSTGVASILLTKDHVVDYNSGLAHAIFYALTSFPQIESNHLHGEVVSYGILVLLLVDKDEENFKKVYEFNRNIGLPLKLADIEIDAEDLEKVAEMAADMKDIEHNPYKITKEMIAEAMKKLENMF